MQKTWVPETKQHPNPTKTHANKTTGYQVTRWKSETNRPYPLHSAVLLKEINTSERILLPSKMPMWHQIQMLNPLIQTNTAHQPVAPCNSTHSIKEISLNSSWQLLVLPAAIDEILHCCTCIGSSRTSALTFRLYTPCLVCHSCATLFSCQRIHAQDVASA